MQAPSVQLGDNSILRLIETRTLLRHHVNSELQSRFAMAFDEQEAEAERSSDAARKP
jgi:hypothetical protein